MLFNITVKYRQIDENYTLNLVIDAEHSMDAIEKTLDRLPDNIVVRKILAKIA